MKALDRFLQSWRIRRAKPFLAGANRVLDIGTHDGALFDAISAQTCVGIDPNLVVEPGPSDCRLLIKGFFPTDLPEKAGEEFDAICILAVLEHLDAEVQAQMAADCYRCLSPGGKVVITTPSPLVDGILDVLFALKLIDAMGETHEDHYGFDPGQVIPVFEGAGFSTDCHRRFQLGLNHLFVFSKP